MTELPPRTAFVLGGGGPLGAHQVGMLRALFEAGVVPDLVVGTSVGAVNGAVVAADPTVATIDRLQELWVSLGRSAVFEGGMLDRVRTLARSWTHLYDDGPLRRLLTRHLPVERIEDTAVPFECVAASIERATPHWFTSGPIVDAVVASSAVPGLLPPIAVGGEHYLDGGLVASIPLDRAVDRGAAEVYVLQVGRVEEPLRAPEKPWEVALVAFEISRRHRFTEALASVPAGVDVHVLPTGEPKSFTDTSQYRDVGDDAVGRRIEASYLATNAYLEGRGR